MEYKLTRQMVEAHFGKPVAWVFTHVGWKHGRELYSALFTDGTDTDFFFDFGKIETAD